MSSLKLGKLPHQLGIVGADEAVGDEEIPKQVFVSNLKTAGKTF